MLVEGVEAADATIVDHDGLLFMFAVVRDGVGGYSDTLAIWSSADLSSVPGSRIRRTPCWSMTVPRGLPAPFLRQDGALYRPVQDCRTPMAARSAS